MDNVGTSENAGTEDRLKSLTEGVRALDFILDVASRRGASVPNVAALLKRTLEDIDALCGEQMARADEGRP